MRFRTKLFLAELACILVVVLALDVLTSRALRMKLLEDLQSALGRQSSAIAEYITALSPAGAKAGLWDAVADRFGAIFGVRVTLIDESGAVLGDSQVDWKNIAGVESHLYRSEIQQALATGEGHSVRYSTTVRNDFIYLARSLTAEPSGIRFIRLAMPLAQHRDDLARWRRILLLASGLGALLAAGFALAFANRFASRISKMAAFASQVGSSRPTSRRVDDPRGDELGALADSLERMSGDIEDKIKTVTIERNQREAILTAMSEGIAAWDTDGRLILSNPAFERLLGLTGVVPNCTPAECLKDAELIGLYDRAVRTREPAEQEIKMQLGARQALLCRFSPILRDGRMEGSIAVFQDVTELRRLEEIRRDFVLSAAHELKTPLASILGFAETLINGAANEPAMRDRFLERIHANAQRLGRLAEDLLTLGRIENGAWPLELKTVKLEVSIARLLAVLQQDIRKKEIEATVTISSAASEIRADEFALEQILLNLLDNAVKYNVQRGAIEIRADRMDGAVEVSVRDSGVGIPEEDVPRIFERFYRVDKARSRDLGGTGLGLSIVKHLVLAHRGDVWAESAPGKGARFIVQLPQP